MTDRSSTAPPRDELPAEERAKLNLLYDAPDLPPPDIEIAGAHAPRSPSSLYSTEAALRTTFDDNLPRLGDGFGFTPAEQQEERKTFSAAVVQAGLTWPTAKLLHNLWTEARLHPEVDADVLEAQLLADAEASRKQLREAYGAEDAAVWLRLATKFVAAHPAIAEMLQINGIGSKPEVIRALVEHVRHVGYR